MTCIIPGCLCEGRARPDWPMPDSPLGFFSPDTWIDDDEIDRCIIASRLCASEFDTGEAAEILGVSRVTMERMKSNGRLFPTRMERTHQGGIRALYSDERVAGEMMRRGVSV